MASGFDALTHAVEGYVARKANPVTRSLAVQALEVLGSRLPRLARVRPEPPACPVVTVTGAVARPAQIPLDALIGPHERRGQITDLHCATTWSALDLSWEGVPFRGVHEAEGVAGFLSGPKAALGDLAGPAGARVRHVLDVPGPGAAALASPAARHQRSSEAKPSNSSSRAVGT